jgi:hypothetical protein
MGMPVKFKYYLQNLDEASDALKAANSGNNRRGVYHELLTGYHLNGKKHMTNHSDKDGHTPEEQVREFESTMSKEDIETAHHGAKHGAKSIKKHITHIMKLHGHHADGHHDIVAVHHTSKPGDTEQVTSYRASQKQDPSDLVVTVKSKKKGSKHLYIGTSLKRTEGKSPNITTANLGRNQQHANAEADHKELINKRKVKHPELVGMSKEDQNKWANDNPKKMEKIKVDTKKSLANHAEAHAKELNAKLKSKDPAAKLEAVEHVKRMLHAHATPSETAGHYHIKVTTTNAKKAEPTTHIEHPHEHFKQIFNDPDVHKKLRVEHIGGNLHVHHEVHGKILSQVYKMGSQSRPIHGQSTVAIGVGAAKLDKDGKLTSTYGSPTHPSKSYK